MEAQLQTTRPVVVTWWRWCNDIASNHYRQWIKTPLMMRSQIRISDEIPNRMHPVEDYIFPRTYELQRDVLWLTAHDIVFGFCRTKLFVHDVFSFCPNIVVVMVRFILYSRWEIRHGSIFQNVFCHSSNDFRALLKMLWQKCW